MRRQVIFIVLALLLVSASVLAADEAVLIDFSLLKADIIEDSVNKGRFLQNRATMMDFSGTAGASYTDEQKKQMHTSLAITQWDVRLSSSSWTNMNQALTYSAEAPVSTNAKKFAGKTVLGVRVRFPLGDFNGWARIKPPFEVPSFEPKATVDDQGQITVQNNQGQQQQGSDPQNSKMSRFEGSYDSNTKIKTAYGVVKNVGSIKAVALNIKGLNYPHGVSVILKDSNNEERTMFMGYLNFDGWQELRWDNPQYISDVRNRELRIYPLYPKSIPLVKIAGFLITRDAAHEGGDFVVYLKDVKILYDKAVLELDGDIDDEALWGIVGKQEAERKAIESKRFGTQAVLRYIEAQKQETRTNFTEEAPKQ